MSRISIDRYSSRGDYLVHVDRILTKLGISVETINHGPAFRPDISAAIKAELDMPETDLNKFNLSFSDKLDIYTKMMALIPE